MSQTLPRKHPIGKPLTDINFKIEFVRLSQYFCQ